MQNFFLQIVAGIIATIVGGIYLMIYENDIDSNSNSEGHDTSIVSPSSNGNDVVSLELDDIVAFSPSLRQNGNMPFYNDSCVTTIPSFPEDNDLSLGKENMTLADPPINGDVDNIYANYVNKYFFEIGSITDINFGYIVLKTNTPTFSSGQLYIMAKSKRKIIKAKVEKSYGANIISATPCIGIGNIVIGDKVYIKLSTAGKE